MTALRSRRLRLSVLAPAVLLAGCAPAAGPARVPSRVLFPPAPAHAEAVEQARALARALVANDSRPGLSVAVGIDGEIVWGEGFGWADVERRRPVTPATRFRIGSTSKPLTAAAAGLLHQRGRLDLDAPVQRYVPSFPRKRWPVTTRQLMGHVAGIRHYGGEDEVLRADRCGDVVQGLEVFAGDSLRFRPGTAYSYSSYGWSLVSAVVQAAAGEPFPQLMRREVFAPLGMHHTALASAEDTSAATFYIRSAGSLAPAPYVDLSCTLAAGGFLSTPADLVRFGFGMMEGDLLAPATLQMLWTPGRLESGESTGYGLGWFVGRTPLGPMVGHGGSSIGGMSAFMIYPEQRMVISVLTNVGGGDATYSLATRLAEVFHRTASR